MNFETLFGGQKPIIGMVHLRPLPGAPNYGGSMEEIWTRLWRILKRSPRAALPPR